mmetsp:Transcript_11815/g.16080  ORF Transcript_11815/g.16080 Transcript_11815/m.16080 type:complete len:100 (+) Transcript_11815:2377-2676(+)|eukprot:CAMPEP_0185580502 /NCGR_PEP_ID=MMETSP0434-20130131/16746_1 /TAXON_ID=626734 ORGANISM="Favella taraikaensis, Strain Fe Narragansett Bay" /NCGR_SAMPLE_ID=MMETSP0434 /ASSEMBLY_ACC=CAM_ASM_000379 /LENGTH=99 /DNA_ID=CAMNT_0028198787 /DNA_START=2377 /DNA_END=2676 /DNA_ORIENTATION=+
MERATGETESRALLEEIVADESKEQGSNDYGCICEIDLSQRRKIVKILSRLLNPSKEKEKTAATNEEKKKQEAESGEGEQEETKGSFAPGVGDTGAEEG